MTYAVNLRDIEFNLFDYLKIQDLGQSARFQGYGKDEFSAILSEANKFAQNEIAPLNKDSDAIGCKFENGKVTTPPGFKAAFDAFAANGFIGMDVPTTYGGMALPVVLNLACGEFFTGACVSFSMYPGLTRGAASLIETFSTEDLSKTYVPNMYSGKWAGTMCLTEPQAGSAVGDIATVAVKEGDHYKIKGTKMFISSGDHDLTENIVHMVLARVEGDDPGTRGISLFIVPKIRVNADGSLGGPNDVQTVNIEHKMGIKGSSTCTLSFGDNNNCIGYLIGEQKKGMKMMFQMMNEARLACGLQGSALAASAYEHALQYSKERVQGNNTLIINYPDVRRMLLTMKSYTEGMRALILYAAHMDDKSHTEEDAEKKKRLQGRLELLTPICKAYCSDMGFKVTELAIQTYGGYGYSSEYPVEQCMRDIKIASIYEGTNAIQSLDLIGRKLAVNAGQLFRDLYEDLSTFCTEKASDATLGKEVGSLKKAIDTLAQVTMKFGEWAMNQDFNSPQLHSLSYLYNCGDVMLSYLLLDQALLANEKLAEICKNKNVNSDEGKAKLLADNEEAKFLDGKVKSALFFVNQILPMATARAKAILSGDDSPLKVVL